MDILTIFIVAFISGILTKAGDLVAEHGLRLPIPISYFVGLIYGILVGTLVTSSDLIGEVWLGAIFGVFIAGKFDHTIHYLGLFSIATIALIRHIPNPTAYTIFAGIAAFVDEKMSDLIDKGVVKAYFEKFLFLEVYCIVLSLVTKDWRVALSILSFDVAYFCTTKIFLITRSEEHGKPFVTI